MRVWALLLCAWLLVLPPAAAAEQAQPIDAAQLDELLKNQRGAVLLVNFWATWCGPCLQELPLLAELRGAYPEDALRIVGISLDYDPQTLASFLQKKPLAYPIFLADQNLMRVKNLSSIPFTLVFDAQGREKLAHKGVLNAATINPLLKELLSR